MASEYDYIGEGAYRIVFLQEDFVYKLAKGPYKDVWTRRLAPNTGKVEGDGVNANRLEVENWRRLQGTKWEELLFPIEERHPNFYWIKMPCADQLEIPWGGVKEFKEKHEDIDIPDINTNNLGILDGEIRALDYGKRIKKNDQSKLVDF